MKKEFNEYMELEAPIQLKALFDEMDESQAIMLQECFHAFARKVVSEQLTAFTDYCNKEHGLFIPSWMIDGYNKRIVSGSALEEYSDCPKICNCETPEVAKPHLGDGGYDWCNICSRLERT